jgi:hypothetical protein
MSETTTTETAADGAARFYVPVEQFYCPGCDDRVPNEHVVAKVRTDNTTIEPTRRDVRLLCPHCNRCWHAVFVLRGGMWQVELAPTEMTEAAAKGLRARIDHVRGVIQERDRDRDPKPGRRLRREVEKSSE